MSVSFVIHVTEVPDPIVSWIWPLPEQWVGGKVCCTVANEGIILVIHRTADGDGAAGGFVGALSDAALGIVVSDGLDVGVGAADGDIAAFTVVTTTNARTVVATRSLDRAPVNGDVAALTIHTATDSRIVRTIGRAHNNCTTADDDVATSA